MEKKIKAELIYASKKKIKRCKQSKLKERSIANARDNLNFVFLACRVFPRKIGKASIFESIRPFFKQKTRIVVIPLTRLEKQIKKTD